MKFFAVKCCRQLHPLTNPHAVLVCLMAAALGFATSENIEYVFSTPYGTGLNANEIFLSQLFVLIVRLLMPVHVICSVIQAANLSRVVLGMQNLSTFKILFAAIILHGTFDCYLFVINTVAFVYQTDDASTIAAAIIGPVLITIFGILYAYVDFNKVVAEYDASWRFQTQSNTSNSNFHHRPPSSSTIAAPPVEASAVRNPIVADAYIV